MGGRGVGLRTILSRVETRVAQLRSIWQRCSMRLRWTFCVRFSGILRTLYTRSCRRRCFSDDSGERHRCSMVKATAAVMSEMMDVKGSARFENCGTEFRSLQCIRQGCLEGRVSWEKMVKYVLEILEQTWEATSWRIRFSGGRTTYGSAQTPMDN